MNPTKTLIELKLHMNPTKNIIETNLVTNGAVNGGDWEFTSVVSD